MKPITYQDIHIGDASLSDDGYYVFFPIENGGYWQSHVLRHIAAELDTLNREWHAKVMADMEKPMLDSATPQTPPTPGKLTVYEYVLADIAARAEAGKEKYGTYLQTCNGRDALMDAYQEALDLCMYLRQAILERESKT